MLPSRAHDEPSGAPVAVLSAATLEQALIWMAAAKRRNRLEERNSRMSPWWHGPAGAATGPAPQSRSRWTVLEHSACTPDRMGVPKGSRRIGVLLGVVSACTSCLTENHPEYSPHTSYTVTQNTSCARQGQTDRWIGGSPSEQAAPPPTASPAPIVPAVLPAPERPAASTVDRTERLARPTVPTAEPVGDRARCHAGDAASCRGLPGVHIGGNVRMYGNVLIFGDVFVNDGVASSRSGEKTR
jgi:hypothetical protein